MTAKPVTRRVGGVLLAAFLFPGFAQMYLGRKLRGLLFAAVALVALGICVQRLSVFVSAIVEETGQSMELLEDPTALATDLLDGRLSDPGISGPIGAFTLIWAVALVDALLIFSAQKRAVESQVGAAVGKFSSESATEVVATEIFDLAGRGAVVVAYGVRSGFTAASHLLAEFTGADGTTRRVRASWELMLRRTETAVVESEAFVLNGVAAADVAPGTLITFREAPAA